MGTPTGRPAFTTPASANGAYPNANTSKSTSGPIFSVDSAALAGRLAAIRAKFVSGAFMTRTDFNELVAIVRIFQTHIHSMQDTFWVNPAGGSIYVSDTIIDADTTDRPKF